MISLFAYRDQWFGNLQGDLLAGLVVALALIPDAIAFSIIAGVDPRPVSMPRFPSPSSLHLRAAGRG